MNTQKQIAVIVTLWFVFVAGCAAYAVIDIPIRANDQADWHFSESVERGALLFANNCRTCHGIAGEGGVGPPLNGQVRVAQELSNFQDQDPLVLRSNKALLQRTLACGRAGTLMPAWLNTNGGALNARQIEHLIDFLTAPANILDENDQPTSKGWEEAVHFAHNLNHETTLVVGGDTLGSIAQAHEVGLSQLSSANNNASVDAVLKKGTKVKLPASVGRPNGRTYEVKKDNETLRKIEQTTNVGAMIIADLNRIPYRLNEKTNTLRLGDFENTARSVGLIPGATLKLPEGAKYVLRAGDTLAAIAAQHGVSASDIERLNPGKLSETDATKPLQSERRLKLPANPIVIVAAGQTAATIAQVHGVEVGKLTDEAGQALSTTSSVAVGQRIKLPADIRYIVQTGDTLKGIAAGHGITEDALASLNELKVGDFISPALVLALPAVEKYRIAGQSLADIARTLSGVEASDIGEAQEPPVDENFIYAIGSQLKMPEDSYGSAPPDAINSGAGCVENAVSADAFERILDPNAGSVTAPAQVSRDVLIEAFANDWTLTADGVKQAPNKGVAKIVKGTSVKFQNVVGVHTITVNKVTEDDSFKGTDTADRVFNDAGQFRITCDIHPAMLATIFVE